MKDDERQPDPETAIRVTAEWTCTPDEMPRLLELECRWQRVGTDADSIDG